MTNSSSWLSPCVQVGGAPSSLSYGPGQGGSLQVSATYRLAPWGLSRRSADAIKVSIIHNVFLDKVVVTVNAIASKKLPPLPRVGVRMRCAGVLDTVEWFGRGPQSVIQTANLLQDLAATYQVFTICTFLT